MQFNIVSCMTMVIIFLMCAHPGNGVKVKSPIGNQHQHLLIALTFLFKKTLLTWLFLHCSFAKGNWYGV